MIRLSLERIAEKLRWLREDCGRGPASREKIGRLLFLEAMFARDGGGERFGAEFVAASREWWNGLPSAGNKWDRGDFDPIELLGRELPARVLMSFPLDKVTPEGFCLWVRDMAEQKETDDGATARFYRRFPGFDAALDSYMAKHAAAELSRTADTTTRRKVFKELDCARETGLVIPLVADSRNGKTFDSAAYFEAFPAFGRLVTVPASNRERDLHAAFMRALRMDFTPQTKDCDMRARIEFVLSELRPFLVFDEAHYLIPLSYTSGTAPRRMVWLREAVIDREIHCAFLMTPQDERQTLARYADKSGYNLKQWTGRMTPPVLIAETGPTLEDLRAVARKQFPTLGADMLNALCLAAMAGGVGFNTLQTVGKRAVWEAQERGAAGVTMADLAAGVAFAGLKPPAASNNLPLSEKPSALKAAAGSARGTNAGVLQAVCREVAPMREIHALATA